MVYCSVSSCKNGNYKQPNLGYFRFPKETDRLDVWLKFCGRNDRIFRKHSRRAKACKDNSLRICSKHFLPETYQKSLIGKYILHKNANPVHPNNNVVKSQSEDAKKAEKRCLQPDKDGDEIASKSPRPSTTVESQFVKETLTASTNSVSVSNPLFDHSYCLENISEDCNVYTPTEHPGKTSIASQTDLTLEDMKQWEEEMTKLKTENFELSKKLNNKAAIKRDLFIEDVLESDEL